MKSNRRNFFKTAGLTGFGLTGFSLHKVFGYEANLDQGHSLSLSEADDHIPLNRIPRIVHEYYVEQIREIEKKANKRRADLKNRQDALDYVQEVRSKINQCFQPWPEKTSLNARVTGTLKRDGYVIEKVIYESRPGFMVSANLYIPSNRPFPLPGILGWSGHTSEGKASSTVQSFSQGLVKQGYVVLAPDPLGQGERVEYFDENLQSLYGGPVGEHLYTGNQMVLTGEALSAWFTWDAIRSIDYLLSRPEVDPKHIGMTGNSGGGNITTWVCGTDPRLTMAAPSCFVSTFRRLLENEFPSDAEQYPPLVLKLGLDHSDFIAAMAPKPVLLLGAERDFFDVRGLEESYARLKYLYKLLGAEENIKTFADAGYHGYSKEQREAMYNWFNHITKISDLKTEPEISLEDKQTLLCTSRGLVGTEGSLKVFSFTSKLSASFSEKRGILEGVQLKDALTSCLRLPDYQGIPEYRVLPTGPDTWAPGNSASKKEDIPEYRIIPVNAENQSLEYTCSYFVENEHNIGVIAYRLSDEKLISRPPTGLKKAILYVSHMSADTEIYKETFLHEVIKEENDTAVFACDVRGIGESQPNTAQFDFLSRYGNDYLYAGHGIMLDYPYLGQKTFDILRLVNWVKSFGHEEIHIVAKGWGTIPSTFAAILSGTITRVTLKNALTSFSEIAESEDYRWPLSSLLPNVLKSFDLPDCYKELNSKKLHQIEPWNSINTGFDIKRWR